MRHDDQRPQLDGFAAEAPVPGRWTPVLAQMRANPLSRVGIEEIRAEAAHIIVVAPSPEVVDACFGELLAALGQGGVVEVLSVDELDAEAISDVPAGTWVFLPHRHDGWTELEAASARLRALLVAESTARGQDAKLTLIEYGANLWLWAEPPESGGDPVCHAGELISWESAWALSAEPPSDGDRDRVPTGSTTSGEREPDSRAAAVSTRPPIYFGLPAILRERRRNS
ncbi:hypothetical protein DFO66_10449 [Brevibacterium sanguinis]|uniref:Uncharacterized protein n=2 Tax=Brevibacterium TaxID=1696 RepID=A0A366IJ03_9MICO|nr:MULTISPECIES: hypothetical protein [Brevibacterium]RBP65466.1 hypothetical protein DFO66_10449 [Brevibacterium sanguinis]RBP72100.1 hypothetical protein DFO65_10455 [Brevibacterium celere]